MFAGVRGMKYYAALYFHRVWLRDRITVVIITMDGTVG